MNRYSAKIRMILGAVALSSAAYFWGAVHSQYETKSLINDVSSKVVRSMGKKSALDTYSESQKDIVALHKENKAQKAFSDSVTDTHTIMINTWKEKYEWLLREDSINKTRLAELTKHSAKLVSLNRKNSTEIARLKQGNIVLAERLALLGSPREPIDANPEKGVAGDRSGKEGEHTILQRKAQSVEPDIGTAPVSGVLPTDLKEYMPIQLGAPVSDQELLKVSPSLPSSDKDLDMGGQEKKGEVPSVKTWGLGQQHSPVWIEIHEAVSQKQKMPFTKYKEEWQWTSRMRLEFLPRASRHDSMFWSRRYMESIRTSWEFMESIGTPWDGQMDNVSPEEKKKISYRTGQKEGDNQTSISKKEEGSVMKSENTNSKRVSSTSYKQLKKLTQDVQAKFNIPGMEVRIQENSGKRFKIWVSYRGNTSKSFFTTTKKYQNRLTPEGMETWVNDTMDYLSHLETVERVAQNESIYLQKKGKKKEEARDGLILQTKEVGSWKMRLAFSNAAGFREVFSLPLNILEEDTLSAMFREVRFRSSKA